MFACINKEHYDVEIQNCLSTCDGNERAQNSTDHGSNVVATLLAPDLTAREAVTEQAQHVLMARSHC